MDITKGSLPCTQKQALALNDKASVADSRSTREMASLLRLYSAALSLHAACAGMQPQVAPLPGQAVIMVRAALLLPLCLTNAIFLIWTLVGDLRQPA